MFVHLHWHSQFSLLEAIWSSKAIIARLKELDTPYAPIQDYNGMYNIIGHYQICKKEDVKPIIWVDLAIQVETQGKSFTRSRYITLLAKNYEWYIKILEIVSKAQITSWLKPPHLTITNFPETDGNIIALVNGYETPIADMIEAGRNKDDLIALLNWYKEVFWEENVILEIIPQDPKENAGLAQTNMALWQIHKTTWTATVASDNFHYILAQDKEAYEIARCIKDAKHIYDEDRRKVFGKFHIMSEDEMYNQCSLNGFTNEEAEEMIEMTAKIAEKIDINIELNKLLFPVYESPEEIKSLYDKFLNKNQ